MLAHHQALVRLAVVLALELVEHEALVAFQREQHVHRARA